MVKYMTIKCCYSLHTNGVMRGVNPFVTKYEVIAVNQYHILSRILKSRRLCAYSSIHIFTKSFSKYNKSIELNFAVCHGKFGRF